MKPDIMALSMSQSGTQLKRENSDALLVVNEEKRLKLEVSGDYLLSDTHNVYIFSLPRKH